MMITYRLLLWIGSAIGLLLAQPALAATLVFENDFESPTGFISGFSTGPIAYTDLSQQPVNSLYGSSFGQNFTVETLNVSGATYSGAGVGNDYALGMLSALQPDLFWLTFDVGALEYVNVEVAISAIDLNGSDGQTLVTPNVAPTFALTLFDGSASATAPPTGALLDSVQFSGNSTTLEDRYAFDWTNHLLTLSAAGASTGIVTLQIDLLQGGYASLDDLTIAASDEPGDVTPPSVPTGILGLLGGMLVLVGARQLRPDRRGSRS